jgi:hypothetical protein
MYIIVPIIIVVVGVIVVAMSLNAINTANNNAIQVTAIDWTHTYYYESGKYAPFSTTFSENGFNATPGSEEIITITINGGLIAGPYALTIDSISTNTPGFMITSISPSLPYTINFGNASISITIQLPSNSYIGVLNLNMIETIDD